jgi:hypothetical protein
MTGALLDRARTPLALAVVALLSAGCIAAAAGAGAAAAIHMSGNSARSEVNATPAQVDAWTQAVLRDMGVEVTSRAETTNGYEYRGTGPGGLDVSVDVEASAAGMTSVTASARRSPVEWDNAFARDLVRRIVARA